MMKKSIKNFTMLAGLLFTLPLFAQQVSGVNVANKITIENTTLQLNGAGVRSKFFIDLYVGSLYLPKTSQDESSILAMPEVVIRLNITSGMISAEKMTSGINEGFNSATNGNTKEITPQIESFLALFKSGIQEGDQFTFIADKEKGVITYKNKQRQATIKGEAFRTALLKIWLGKDPAQQSLKDEMLGKD